ncbi:hypothetical protein [Mycobacterium saskatchewanense]|nr:hypothetical protein [Mycobacterium saskatchewanense]
MASQWQQRVDGPAECTDIRALYADETNFRATGCRSFVPGER